MHKIMLFMIAIMMAGCAGTYNSDTLKALNSKLSRNAPVTIITPTNGQFGEITYSQSGQATAASIKSAFMDFADEVYAEKHCDLKDCFSDLKSSDGYLVYPEILHWEDRATEWSGIRDKVTIKIIVYNIRTKTKLSSTIINGESSFWTLGGDHPQDLIDEPINKYISSLY